MPPKALPPRVRSRPGRSGHPTACLLQEVFLRDPGLLEQTFAFGTYMPSDALHRLRAGGLGEREHEPPAQA